MTSAIVKLTWTGAHFPRQQGTMILYAIGPVELQQWFDPDGKARWNVRLDESHWDFNGVAWERKHPGHDETLLAFWASQPGRIGDHEGSEEFIKATKGRGVLHGRGTAQLPY